MLKGDRNQANSTAKTIEGDMRLVADVTSAWLELPSAREIYMGLAESLRQVIGDDALISVSSCAPRSHAFEHEVDVGRGPLVERVVAALGRVPASLTGHASPALRQVLASGRLTRLEGGVAELTGGLQQPGAARQLADILGHDEAFVVGIARTDVIGGVAIIPMRSGAQLRQATIEALAHLAAATIERARAQQEVAMLKHSVDIHRDGAYWMDTASRFVYVNVAGHHQLGYAPGELIGRSLADVNPAGTPERMAMVWERLRREGAFFNRSTHRRKDGSEFPVEIMTTLVRFGGEEYACGFARDVTEQQRAAEEKSRLEATLVQAQKMEAVGQLAGGIAHDFNNILAAMIMQLNMLRLQPGVPAAELTDTVDELLESANRAANLTRQLLLFSRRHAMKAAHHDVNVIVAELVQLLGRLLGEQVSLVVDTPREPLWIEGDPGMIEQVVTNLCVNARDAMPGGGRLTIVTRAQTLDADAVKGRGSAQPGPFVCLRVEDTGFGMEPEVMEHLFEPFFTTKPQGKGTGLGLATVHGIVAKHMGFVTVESQVGKGSTFSVFLPRATAPDVRARSNPLVSVRGGTERIMVVEDELAVRTVAVRCLRKLGYHVTEAVHGPDALAIWKREGGAFDLLFTDMVMPEGVSGVELCSRLREDAAGLRTIITSGYSAEIVDLERLSGSGVIYLAKPYDVATLASTVRECLDRPS